MNNHNPPHYKGKDHPSWKGGKIKGNCDECKKNIERHPSLLKIYKFHFCDRKCFNNWKRENQKGRKNPFFGKKHTSETKKKISLIEGGTGIPYENTEYGLEFDSSLKESVRFRDSYKCKLCGCSQLENGKQLDIDHFLNR